MARSPVSFFNLATGQQLRTFALGDFQVGQDLVKLLLGRLGADHGVGVQRVATLDRLDLLHHHFHEVVVDRLLHQGARWAGAHFALVEERQHQAFGSFFDECRFRFHDVGEEDIRRLAAQLNGRRNDVLGRRVHDVRAHRGRTGEGDLGDTLAGRQGFAGFLAETVHNVQYAWRQQVADQFHQYADAQRGLLGGLEYHAVAGGQGRGEFPGGHQQREVPRDDLADHAQWFMEVIGGSEFVDFGAAAFLGANAACEVAEVVGGQGMSALRVSRTALPLSQVSVMASNSRFCSIRSAIFSSTSERSWALVLPQASAAAWAASSALSMSLAVERGKSAMACH